MEQDKTKHIDSKVRRKFFWRATALSLFLLVIIGGVTVIDFGNIFGDLNFRTSVIEPGGVSQSQNNLVAVATPDSGNYPKGSLPISLNINAVGDIRYAINTVPNLQSPIYPGYGVDVYSVGKSSAVLNTIVVAPDLSVGPVTSFRYFFVPPSVSKVTAVPDTQGRVNLSWNGVDDSDLSEYLIKVDNEEGKGNILSTRRYTQFTVSGLSLAQHSFAVVAKDIYGAESAPVTVYATPLGQTAQQAVHSAAVEEVTFEPADVNKDGAVDLNDLNALLDELPGGVTLDIVDTVLSRFVQ
jgi:hypothetical protein